MTSRIHVATSLLLIVAIAGPAPAQDVRKQTQLPEGSTGIASQHPGDVGIDQHRNVVFVENFNDDLEAVKSRWDSVQTEQNLSLATDVPASSDGKYSLLIDHVGGRSNGSHLYRRLGAGYDKLHYRFYVKFDADCAPIHHFFHTGGYNPATPWAQGGAGERPVGNERFTTGVEPHGNNWRWDYYSYWMKMRGSPPRGQCWGNSFIHDSSLKVTRGRWQCLELMMKVNDVGQSNGEMALWIDGDLVSHLGEGFPNGKWVFDKFLPGQGGEGAQWSDKQKRRLPLTFADSGEPFEGFQWRSDEKLKLNFLWLLCYITKSPPGHASKIWFDDVVVAEEYIGPIQAP
jgi:hypothetical protein